MSEETICYDKKTTARRRRNHKKTLPSSVTARELLVMIEIQDDGITRNESKPLLSKALGNCSINTDKTYSSPKKNYLIDSQNTYSPSSGQRRPFSHVPSLSNINDNNEDIAAIYHRYKYYSKLTENPQDESFNIPDHVLPVSLLVFPAILTDPASQKKQSSIVTIFSVWNTMMGSSLLCMPWAIGEAGLVLGVFFLVFMAVLTCYTAYRVIRSLDGVERKDDNVMEFSEVCSYYFGKWGLYISTVFSVSALLGGAMAYWVLMSSFLYHAVKYIYDEVNNFNMSVALNVTDSAICLHPPSSDPNIPNVNLTVTGFSNHLHHHLHNTTESETLFFEMWQQTLTVPFFLVLILFPLINFKSPTFFTKFNSVGTLSVMYILVFVTVKAAKWGLNIEFNGTDPVKSVPLYNAMFPALTGMLSLSYFLHNGILSIMHNQRHPENNGRDLSIAYVLVAITYTWIGVVFYITFPLEKNCIESNLLDNFPSADIMAFVGRLLLLFQLVTIYPLILYILRVQLLCPIFGTSWPGAVVSVCVLCAIFLPEIGTIIRFSGAFSGLAYIFTLPCLVYLAYLWKEGRLTYTVVLFHSFIIALGVANFVGQFAIFAIH
uniref:Sodium-coupled neutral amino acid transporter 9-like n=1 Tax=Saccoglossus kowalevskii TaxID=10224 RepID=A0ABM0M075_SACKO|nr:PREDICTED: putative sodium-coupled neutral amino acid transporter 9-like [Saccoglossus kowalevskii]